MKDIAPDIYENAPSSSPSKPSDGVETLFYKDMQVVESRSLVEPPSPFEVRDIQVGPYNRRLRVTLDDERVSSVLFEMLREMYLDVRKLDTKYATQQDWKVGLSPELMKVYRDTLGGTRMDSTSPLDRAQVLRDLQGQPPSKCEPLAHATEQSLCGCSLERVMSGEHEEGCSKL